MVFDKGYVDYRDPLTGRFYEFLTNNFRLAATAIAAIYKDRWQLELFFKAHQTKSKNKSLFRSIKECSVNANLDRNDHVFTTCVCASQCQSSLDGSANYASNSIEFI